jgi:hypothetical protein
MTYLMWNANGGRWNNIDEALESGLERLCTYE